jgi:hypothetical protein
MLGAPIADWGHSARFLSSERSALPEQNQSSVNSPEKPKGRTTGPAFSHSSKTTHTREQGVQHAVKVSDSKGMASHQNW